MKARQKDEEAELLVEVEYISGGLVRIEIFEDDLLLKAGREVSLRAGSLPGYLKADMREIERLMRKYGIASLEISQDPRQRILVDKNEYRGQCIGSATRLRTFAHMLSAWTEWKSELQAKRNHLAALEDRRQGILDLIARLESEILVAKGKLGEIEPLADDLKRRISAIEESLKIDEQNGQRDRDRESRRIPRGHHRKVRAAK